MPSAGNSSFELSGEPEGFDEYCRETNAVRVEILIRLSLAIMFLVGPIEYFILRNRPDTASWQMLWMIAVGAVFLAATATFYLVPLFRRHADVFAAGFSSISMGIAGVGVSQVGGLETLYTGIALVSPMIASMVLVPLRRRIWIAAITPASFLVAFFLSRPEAIQYPFAGVPIFHASLAVTVSIVFGHVAYRLTLENYAQRRMLAGETAKLDTAVQERTAEVMELARNLVSLEETERTRIARELHDELGQQLTAARLEAGSAAEATRELIGADSPQLHRVTGVEASIALAQQTVREVVFSLRPPALDDFDLNTALQILVDRYRQPGRLTVDYENSLDGAVLTDTQATTVFRVMQEALTNVVRHADATTAAVRLGVDGGRVELSVSDNGRGEPSGGSRMGFGLRGMRERLRLVHGEVAFEQNAGGGMAVRARFPLRNSG